MKEMQIKRIEEFIDSLDQTTMEDGQQAIVLQSELNSIGGKNGTCTNSGKTACLADNGKCSNSGGCGPNNGRCNNCSGEGGKPGVQ